MLLNAQTVKRNVLLCYGTMHIIENNSIVISEQIHGTHIPNGKVGPISVLLYKNQHKKMNGRVYGFWQWVRCTL